MIIYEDVADTHSAKVTDTNEFMRRTKVSNRALQFFIDWAWDIYDFTQFSFADAESTGESLLPPEHIDDDYSDYEEDNDETVGEDYGDVHKGADLDMVVEGEDAEVDEVREGKYELE